MTEESGRKNMDNQRDKRIEEIRDWLHQQYKSFPLSVVGARESDSEFLLNEIGVLREEVSRLQVERDKAIEGLKWYADSDNYTRSEEEYHQGYPQEIMWDKGIKARNVLSELGVPHDPLD